MDDNLKKIIEEFKFKRRSKQKGTNILSKDGYVEISYFQEHEEKEKGLFLVKENIKCIKKDFIKIKEKEYEITTIKVTDSEDINFNENIFIDMIIQYETDKYIELSYYIHEDYYFVCKEDGEFINKLDNIENKDIKEILTKSYDYFEKNIIKKRLGRLYEKNENHKRILNKLLI